MANEDIDNGKMTRPVTAMQRVFDKVSTVFTSTESAKSHDNGLDDKTNTSKISSQILYDKLNKILKSDIKSKKHQLEFSNSINLWGQSIPHLDTSLYVKEFSMLLNTEVNARASLIDQIEKIKLSLSYVNEREKKQKTLLTNKAKLDRKYKDAKNKFGPNASNTILLKEAVEEIDCNLQVVEQQFVRSLINDLKDALVDYAFALNTTAKKLEDASSEFMQRINDIDEGEGGGENELARISPMKYSKSKRKPPKYPSPYSDHDTNSGESQIKLKNYSNNNNNNGLPTPQSLCSECKKSPCMHSEHYKNSSPQQQHNQQGRGGEDGPSVVQHNQIPIIPQMHPIPQVSRQNTAQHQRDDNLQENLQIFTRNRNNSISFSDHWS
ncbi:hypothetical protein G210_1752 [Candida maltosa Xu316]|uniref:Uncharacterized protein n=1 Tax=Candida maltosa (strain Xu316) TaxID=1245528 RepID=M3IN18_CANMX|nr:hypothetical protein G210_1752 [Candida maltosa Xu316]